MLMDWGFIMNSQICKSSSDILGTLCVCRISGQTHSFACLQASCLLDVILGVQPLLFPYIQPGPWSHPCLHERSFTHWYFPLTVCCSCGPSFLWSGSWPCHASFSPYPGPLFSLLSIPHRDPFDFQECHLTVPFIFTWEILAFKVLIVRLHSDHPAAGFHFSGSIDSWRYSWIFLHWILPAFFSLYLAHSNPLPCWL